MSEEVCRGCGSTEAKRKEWMAAGYVNCCPERGMNEAIEQRYGKPAMVSEEDYQKELLEDQPQ